IISIDYPPHGTVVVSYYRLIISSPVTVVPPPGAVVVRGERTEGRHVRQQYSIFMAFELAVLVQN
ncbi:hypothetical protein PMAYCL1PPCAC_28959, partial [Pristionchus mayeri]